MTGRRPIRALLLATSALMPLSLATALANPQGGQVAGGAATIQSAGSTLTVNQTSDRAIINWQTFNIGAGETTRFVQPGASSIALNRVTGGLGPSLIDGTLTANGRVFVVNADGILIGVGAKIDTAGFLATTSDIRNADFLGGRYVFSIPGQPDASVVNLGVITASNSGFAALVAPGVRNSGTITATFGKIGLASANGFTLDFYGDKLITLNVSDSIAATVKDVATGRPLSSLVTNDGKLKANGGVVQLTAVAARKIVDSVINTSGVIEARTIGHRNGKIVLGGPTATTKVAGAPTQTVKVSGKLDASGKKKGQTGGTIQVTGENIVVANAKLDASGNAGGGKVLIGGDVGGGNPSALAASLVSQENYAVPTATTVSIDGATTINASAIASGNGGKVVVWSDGATAFAGSIAATGGAASGNGGFAEVSGHGTLAYTGFTDLSAAHGTFGTLLLDPFNVTISDGTNNTGGSFTANANDSVINATTLSNALGSANVEVSTGSSGSQAGNITVTSAFNWSAPTALTLQAANNIAINARIAAANGGLMLSAGNAISATGAVDVAKFVLQGGNWIQVASTLPAFSAQDFEIAGGSFLRATGGAGTSSSPWQIADVYGLQGIGSSSTLLASNYVLANDVDASGTASWNAGAGFVPIGQDWSGIKFSGTLNGVGHTISGLQISLSNFGQDIGLFGAIGAGGTVQNLQLTNAAITASVTPTFPDNYQSIGLLVGSNFGTVNNVSVAGNIHVTVNLTSGQQVTVGGLAGFSGDAAGTITQSQSTANVTVRSTNNSSLTAVINAGGLVGDGDSIANSTASGAVSDIVTGAGVAGGLAGFGGNIVASSASGAVNGGDNSFLGGLVGMSHGSITSSYATGAVAGGANSTVGGLVGLSTPQLTGSTPIPSPQIQTSYATGAVTAGNNSYAGGLVGQNGGSPSLFGTTYNFSPLPISQSYATGNVAVGANAIAGGLVGQNAGTISGPSWITLPTLCGAGNACASGAVSVGQLGYGGGFVGYNSGTISYAFATGNVTGAAGTSQASLTGGATEIGGFAGVNPGQISNSFSIGMVGTANVPYLQASGFAAENGGTITNSFATGAVITGDYGLAGGFVGHNDGGGAITSSQATGNVTVGAFGAAGGFAGSTDSANSFTGVTAAGSVSAGDNSIVGGLIGGSTGTITASSSTSVVAGGNYSLVGGLVGFDIGTITSSSATGAVSGGTNSVVGGLVGAVGTSTSQITQAYATGAVIVGANSFAGGLVGTNGGTVLLFGTPVTGVGAAISQSYATGSVTSAGANVQLGGLVGYNSPGAIITNSQATGAVTATANATDFQNISNVGGLVGINVGTITSTTKPFAASSCVTGASFSCAVGNVSVGVFGNGGGLVGMNDGTINKSFATGAITSAPGLPGFDGDDNRTGIGGLAARNDGTITDSLATGNVGAPGVAYLIAAGLVAENNGTILRSFAFGNVRTGDNGHAGGLVSTNGPCDNLANCSSMGDGQNNAMLIQDSRASGAVSVGAESYAGGLVVFNVSRGTIVNAFATGAVSGGDGGVLGGLVGANSGLITSSGATGDVTAGANADLGGLVGFNSGTISRSWATGNVTATGTDVQIGGLVGYNSGLQGNLALSGIILNSRATGAVTGNAASDQSGCNSTGNCTVVDAGGLVGFNQGLVLGTDAADVRRNPANGAGTYATGAVSVGSNGIGGGLVGQNDGIIRNTLAIGAVTGLAGDLALGRDDSGATTLGGLAGTNSGRIVDSAATGNVGAANVAGLSAGGLVGHNSGTIRRSIAAGSVTAGDNSVVGGLVADNSPGTSDCGGCLNGLGHNNNARIRLGVADGDVTAGDTSFVGGFVGTNGGTITLGLALGAVSGGGGSAIGGFAGASNLDSVIKLSAALGSASSTGAGSVVGGFIGANGGTIDRAIAFGDVNGTTGSYLGGFAGVNIGSISGAGLNLNASSDLRGNSELVSAAAPALDNASGAVNGSGANNVAGGFVGFNAGAISDQSTSSSVTSGANSIIGSVAGANTGTITDSSGTGPLSGGPGSVIGNPIGIDGPTTASGLPPFPTLITSCSDPICASFQTATVLPEPPTTTPDVPDDVLVPIIIAILGPVDHATQQFIGALISLPPPTDPAGPGGPGGGGGLTGPGANGGQPFAPPMVLRPIVGPDGERFSSIPPINETRFFRDQVLLEVPATVSPDEVARVARELGLSIISTQNLGSIGRVAFQFRLTGGRTVRDIIRALERNRITAIAQPNYQFNLMQADAETQSDNPQYAVNKLHLTEAHRTVSGKNVTIAVIDSEVDQKHSELKGAVSEELNVLGPEIKAHPHGTAMVGAIASRDRLTGVAPGANIIAVRAFGETATSAEGTTYNILKGIEWAVSQGARVINMSFAGPYDPSLARALKAAADKGVVLISAAGNAGPKSPALFPGADPNVIAVTATDSRDKLFRMANQGGYVAVAAPGVDVLAPAPEEAYQMSTGTSIATAHVSGVVALMLERDPTLTPPEVRKILEATAVDLGPKGRDNQFGWGLISPERALVAVDARKKTVTKPAKP